MDKRFLSRIQYFYIENMVFLVHFYNNFTINYCNTLTNFTKTSTSSTTLNLQKLGGNECYEEGKREDKYVVASSRSKHPKQTPSFAYSTPKTCSS